MQDTLNVAMQRMEEQRPSSTPHHGLWGARPVDEIETLGVKGGRGTKWLGRNKKKLCVLPCATKLQTEPVQWTAREEKERISTTNGKKKTGSKNSRPDHRVFCTEEELIMWAKGFIFSDGHVQIAKEEVIHWARYIDGHQGRGEKGGTTPPWILKCNLQNLVWFWIKKV